MNILYHHRTQGQGGEGVHIREIINAFRKIGHDVTLLSPPGVDPFSAVIPKELQKKKSGFLKSLAEHLPQVIFEFMELGYNVYAFFKINKILKHKNIDFVYERYSFFCLAGVSVAQRNKVPLILEVNEISGIKRQRAQTLVNLCTKIENKVFQKANALLAVSDFLKEELIKRGIPAEKIYVIPNAVNLNDFDLNIETKNLKEKYRLDNKFVITFVGVFSVWDRLDLLLKVFSDIQKKFNHVHLLMVGDGEERPQLENNTKALGLDGSITFTRMVHRSEVPRFIAASDVCLLSGSNPFGSPIALFEYMAMQKPAVAPRYNPTESIIEDRKDGILFHPDDEEDLKKALLELIQEEEKRAYLGKNAREKIIQNHTWDKNVQRILNIVGKLQGVRL
jgi:glycosyltransferase involved in cell wall biosynthesis